MLATSVREARVERGWSITELAGRAGLVAQSVRRIEAGTGSIESLDAVAGALECRLSHMPNAATIAGQIEAQRHRRGITVTELAASSGLSRMTVRALAQGNASMASANKAIAALAPNARFKLPPRASWDRSIANRGDDQFTPEEFLARIESVFGEIGLDPAWHELSAVVADRTYSLANGQDGLCEPWSANFVWVNPPYSQLLKWLRKADEEWSSGRARTIVSLVPARTDSTYFHDRLAKIANIYLLRRRLRFVQLDGKVGNQAPFALMLVLFGSTPEQRTALSQQFQGLWIQPPI